MTISNNFLEMMMTNTIFIIILIITGIIIFALYKYMLSSGNEAQSPEKYMDEPKYHNIGDVEKTIVTATKAIQQNPNDVVSRFLLGKLYLDKKHYQKALELFVELKQSNKKHLPTREKIAECYIGLNVLHKAEEELNFILGRKPDDINALNTLSLIYEKNKNKQGTMSILKRILEKEPNNTRIREKLARLCEVNGEFTRAIKEYEILYSKDPIMDIARKLAELYYKSERPQEAINMFEKIVSENPNDKKTIKELALIYWDLDDYDNALIYFEKLEPVAIQEEELINDYICQIYLYKEDNDKVQEICNMFLKKNPESESARLNLSKAYLGKQEFQTAIDIVKDLLAEAKIAKKEQEIHDYLSNVFGDWAVNFFEQGNFLRAKLTLS
jgi:tetratricopeptide (TPR) repeat protein